MMLVRKIPKSGILLGILLIVVVVGCGSVGTTEGTSDTTIVSTISTTTTIPQVSFKPAQAGGTGSDAGLGVAVTSDGGAIVTGYFTGKSTFGSTTLTSNGEDDVFVGKISSTGVREWTAQAGGTGQDFGYGVAVTSDGGVIITGEFSGKSTFGATTLTSNDGWDVFVGKVSSTGEWLWAIQVGGGGPNAGRGVAVTSDGGAIVTGEFSGKSTFGATTLISYGRQDVFVGKISAAGVWEWVTQVGGTEFDYGYGLSVTSDGGAIVTGKFPGTATFGSTTLTASGESDVFVGKISAAGVWLWATQAGGTGLDGGRGVAVTSDGGAIVTGYFIGTATFESTTLTSNGEDGLFVSKISSAGVWEWATQAGGTGLDGGRGVAVTSDGGAIVTGWFNGTATFESTTLTSSGESDLFVGKISSAGVWLWVTQAGGTGLDGGVGVSVTSDGGAIITGGFAGTATFGSTTLTSNGEQDVFVGKISSTGVWES